MQKLFLPNQDRNKGGAEFDPAAVLEAIATLKLVAPVEVKWSAGRRRWGAHRFRDGVLHVITISTYLKPAQASRTLWHELAHARQVEVLGEDAYFASYKAYGKSGVSYRMNPFEVEAERFSELHEVFPLTRDS